MTLYKVLALAVVAYTTCAIPGIDAQFKSGYECNKYCHESCSEYFPGPEFSSCVSANVHCSCNTKISSKNPLLIFLLVATIFVSCFIFAICYRACKHHQGRPNATLRTIAYPIPPISATTGSSGTTGANSRRSSQTNNSSRTSQRNTGGVVNPLAPQSSGDIPPEYLAPPPYNECVIDMSFPEKLKKEEF